MPEELLPQKRYARRIKDEKDFREHKIFRDRVFEEHESSTKNANKSSSRAHSAQQSVRDTINDANSVIETYVKAEQNFKLSMQ